MTSTTEITKLKHKIRVLKAENKALENKVAYLELLLGKWKDAYKEEMEI